jgi:ABC-type Na+ efflux pump permease subunit
MKQRLTETELMVRLKVIVGSALSLTLMGIVFMVLYALIFVEQDPEILAPIDQKLFELIIPIATFLTGTLSGIMLSSPSGKQEEQQEDYLEE